MTEKTEKTDPKQDAEDAIIRHGEEVVHEMRSAMTTMMEASTKMMQSWLDMRLSYLKVMRSGLDDPQATFELMSKNMTDVAKAMKDQQRQ